MFHKIGECLRNHIKSLNYVVLWKQMFYKISAFFFYLHLTLPRSIFSLRSLTRCLEGKVIGNLVYQSGKVLKPFPYNLKSIILQGQRYKWRSIHHHPPSVHSFSSFTSLSKYSSHLPSTHSPLVSTFPSPSLIILTCWTSFPAWSLSMQVPFSSLMVQPHI